MSKSQASPSQNVRAGGGGREKVAFLRQAMDQAAYSIEENNSGMLWLGAF